PDPTVPDADNQQQYNRYSYVLGNPLSYTDPSGFATVPAETLPDAGKIAELVKSGLGDMTLDRPGMISFEGDEDESDGIGPVDSKRNLGTREVYSGYRTVVSVGSLGLDLVPVLGSAKSAAQVVTGKDLLTGEPVNRWVEAGGIVLGMVPGGKLLTKGTTLAKVARGAEKEAAKETTRVGRWMSEAEHEAMKASGKVQESLSGTTHVANPADASAFMSQAKPGSVYIEFNVPTSSLKATNEGWAKVIGPNSLEGRLAARKGLPIPQMPEVTDIVHSATKLP
uniref:TreTu family toxin n=1 Tax=Chitinivorax sp. B TaxID=2502235 RepID=UPI002017D470